MHLEIEQTRRINLTPEIMKKILHPVFAIVIAMTISTMFTNCGDNKEDPDPTPEPNPITEQLKLLAGEYSVSSVKLDGTEVTSDYTGMKITFTTSKGYSTSGGDFTPVWKASGSFIFKDETSTPPVLTSLIRDDGVEMAYTLSGSAITLNFNIKDPNGRLAGLEGQYEFKGSK
jgi:hypothetical protein